MDELRYKNFIGIDVGKDWLDVAEDGKPANPQRFPNDGEGFAALASSIPDLAFSFVVLESTGGYEREALAWLRGRGVAVHRADGRRAKQFIRSLGANGKTDALDAKGLARYARERHASLPVYAVPTGAQSRLQALRSRRDDLSAMIVQEKNRAASPAYKDVAEAHVAPLLAALEERIRAVDAEIDSVVDGDADMREKRDVLIEIPGVGTKTACAILAFMPELGETDRRKAASLAGLAPHPNDSGRHKGRRSIRGGRANLRKALFPAAMGAVRQKNGELQKFYLKLREAGKRPIVALTAVMRKIIVIANAKLRTWNQKKSSIEIPGAVKS